MSSHEPWCSIHDPEMVCNCIGSRQASSIRNLEIQLANSRRVIADWQARYETLLHSVANGLVMTPAPHIAIPIGSDLAMKLAIEAAVANEREACAILCGARSETLIHTGRILSAVVMGDECAAAIRARSKT